MVFGSAPPASGPLGIQPRQPGRAGVIRLPTRPARMRAGGRGACTPAFYAPKYARLRSSLRSRSDAGPESTIEPVAST